MGEVEGDIEDVDGVLKVTQIRVRFRLWAAPGARNTVRTALERFAARCPAYQSVRGAIAVSWEAEIEGAGPV